MFGLDAPETVLIKGENGRVFIPVANYSAVSARLSPGACSGSVSCVAARDNTTISPFPTQASEDNAAHCLNITGEVADSPERLDRLFTALKLDKGTLTDVHFRRLKEFISQNSDLLALHDSELGHTTLVEHKVDTGDHPPLKQPVRRIPIYLS